MRCRSCRHRHRRSSERPQPWPPPGSGRRYDKPRGQYVVIAIGWIPVVAGVAVAAASRHGSAADNAGIGLWAFGVLCQVVTGLAASIHRIRQRRREKTFDLSLSGSQ
jgi:hypothetical protein